MMDRFYKLKSYLMKIDIMPRDTNFAFNLSHVRITNTEEQCLINKLDNSTLAKILTYLPWDEAFPLRLVNKKWKNSVTDHCSLRLSMFMAEIENLKISNSDAMFRKLSFFYELGGFFSPHLHALDYVLHQEIGFVTRYHVEELKKIYKPHKIMKQIMAAFCVLTGIKPKRKGTIK